MRIRDWFAILVCLVLAAACIRFGKSLLESQYYESREINRDQTRRETTILLDNSNWVEFQVAAEAQSFRLLTNAALKSLAMESTELNDPRLGWRYSIQYQLLDQKRNLIFESIYHFRSNVKQLLDAENGEPVYTHFFGKTSMVSTQTCVMQQKISRNHRQTAIVRVRVNSADPQIQEIVGRVNIKMERPDFQRRETWNRLSRERRDAICNYSVFPQDLLSETEKQNLLRWRWTPAPTIGRHTKRYLFFVGELDDFESPGDDVQDGWVGTVRFRRIVVPVPVGNARLKLDFERGEDAALSPPVDVHISSIDDDILQQNKSHFVFRDPKLAVDMDVRGGMVEIESSRAVAVRAFWNPDDESLRRPPEQSDRCGANTRSNRNGNHAPPKPTSDFCGG